MSDKVFTLLILFLTLRNVCTEFQVWTLLQNSYYDNSTVNIICQHNALKNWTMRASVSINGRKVCSTDQNDTACKGKKEDNLFNFTLKMTAEQIGLPCHCIVYRSVPLPVLMRDGAKIMLHPGCNIHSRTKDIEEGSDYPQSSLAGLLTWVLLGIVLLLFFYSSILTAVYIKLRIKITEELKLIYVPMQKKVKRNRADKNAEYMDMREVHHQVQPIRDVNHNSGLNPMGATV